MERKAQAAMEYFVQFGWVFILVATFFGLLGFITSPMDKGVACRSSDPASLEITQINAPGPNSPHNELVFANKTGGEISITRVAFDPAGYFEGFEAATLNDEPLANIASNNPLGVEPQALAALRNFSISQQKFAEGKITITYNAGGRQAETAIICQGQPLS